MRWAIPSPDHDAGAVKRLWTTEVTWNLQRGRFQRHYTYQHCLGKAITKKEVYIPLFYFSCQFVCWFSWNLPVGLQSCLKTPLPFLFHLVGSLFYPNMKSSTFLRWKRYTGKMARVPKISRIAIIHVCALQTWLMSLCPQRDGFSHPLRRAQAEQGGEPVEFGLGISSVITSDHRTRFVHHAAPSKANMLEGLAGRHGAA